MKKLKVLQSQVDTLKQELSSSKDKTQELETFVSELQPYKEQAQVSTNPPKYRHISSINVFYIFCQELVSCKKVILWITDFTNV